MLLEYAVFGYFVYRLGLPLLQAFPNLRKFEEERLRNFRESNVWDHIRRSFLDCILIGVASIVAWRHADLGFFWLAFAILLFGLAIPVAFAWTFNKFNPVLPLDP